MNYPLQLAEQARQEAEATLKEYSKDRPQLDTRLRKLSSEKAKLELDLKHRDKKMDTLLNTEQMVGTAYSLMSYNIIIVLTHYLCTCM